MRRSSTPVCAYHVVDVRYVPALRRDSVCDCRLARRATIIGATPYPVVAATIWGGHDELISRSLKAPVNLGLSLHAFRHVVESIDCDLGFRPMHDQVTTLRSLLSHEPHGLCSSRIEPT
jgi:hypothetical protein